MRTVVRAPLGKLLRAHHCGLTVPLPQQFQQRKYADDAGSNQAHPFQGYYADLLDAPLRSVQPAMRTAPAEAPEDKPPSTEEEEKLAKFRIVFGSRLAGPGERKREIEGKSQLVAGVSVPPRPDEPDNCCMSGCVNCVWDTYRDEMEEWAAKSAEARAKTIELRTQGKATGMMARDQGTPSHVATSMDDDGGGSETSWAAGSGLEDGGQPSNEDLFADIPVGFREFMRTEKKLKAKHRQKVSLAV